PRWYNQMYVMFLVLRQAPDNTASRSELVRKAVELDKKISMERGLPRAFTGKTPQNSASALLTNNGDRHFVQFRPEGARCYHFKLAYKPGDFDGALAAYEEWMEVLVKKDWPLCFGPEPLPVPVPELVPEAATVAEQAGNEALVANIEAESGDKQLVVDAPLLDELDVGQVDIEASNLQPDPQPNTASKSFLQDSAEKVSGEIIATTDRSPSSTSSLPLLQFVCKSVVCPENAHSEPDANIPKSWRDIVEVKPSSIPGAGNGLFAIRNLPGGIPLGFYFGVPMTEDEFDSLKENVGMASHYSIMYRKTVLDATDENGLPYTDPLGALYCPFHFMNEDREGNRDNIVFLEGIKVNQIICLTSRQIKVGEELFVSYGSEVDRSHWDSKSDVSSDG
ncbi:hypothetical protein BX661DRAFT_124236, partial [Kickxella alabastrina]|uniref:uncharacterized protein n=1 Tax=Kickxella alabastrina TaxID=61397 RepID=UPI00221E5DBB